MEVYSITGVKRKEFGKKKNRTRAFRSDFIRSDFSTDLCWELSIELSEFCQAEPDLDEPDEVVPCLAIG